MAITFEGYERRINQINKALNEVGISSIEEAEQICKEKGLQVIATRTTDNPELNIIDL